VSCQRLDLGGGVSAWICGVRAPRRAACSVPHCERPAAALCDFPLKTKTCDAKLCETHRVKVGDDRDHCPAHARAGQLALGVR